ncbi:zinc-binding dehydrogenase [Tianweitania sediminis]|uniref:Zinc-binding dehydrogenase n=1 Tax=Tianweitania sediminis TaxID=1502156 RepID=A0A8J7RK15_9HYPH|nr:zinc-binding dehydrogenase [Tianweitania sediminis]MBP0437139.1 zinc-binding dehydrogenase [Tianweitania sediminis]
MKAVELSRFGEALGVVDKPLPEPAKNQVRVRMLLSPIHNHDLMIVKGVYGTLPTLPAVPGTEAVGIVDALGEGVTGVQVGQRVTGNGAGTWAEYYLAEAPFLTAVPENLDNETACQLMSMPLSAKMILADLDVKEGDWIIQNAGNGLVGKLVSRFGKKRGINVISLVRRDDAVAELAQHGVDTVVSTEAPDWRDRVKEMTGGAPIIRALDSVGGEAAGDLLDLLGDGGELVNFGALSAKSIKVSPSQLLFRGLRLRGFWAAKPSLSRETVLALRKELLDEAAAGELHLPVERQFSLDEIGDAVQASQTPGRKGKIVLAAR